MDNSRIQVVRATFSLGNLQLDGYKDEKGENYMSSFQVSQVISMSPDTTSDKRMDKQLKALLGEHFSTLDGEYRHTQGRSSLKLWKTEYVSTYWAFQASKGNKPALALIIACAAETLDRRIDSAFNQAKSEEEYNDRLKHRIASKITRRQLTDSIKDYIQRHSSSLSDNQKRFLYKHTTDRIYIILFGKIAKKIREEFKLADGANLRQVMSSRDIAYVEKVEDLATRLIDSNDVYPMEAIDEAIYRLLLDKVHFDYQNQRI